MFSFREFIKRGFLNAVGKLADYQIILNASGWFDKGVLTEDDLAEIQSAIDMRNANANATVPGANANATVTDAEESPDTGASDTPSGEPAAAP